MRVGTHPEGEYPRDDTLFAKIRTLQGEVNNSLNLILLYKRYIENFEDDLNSVLSNHLQKCEKEKEKEVRFLIAKIECYTNIVDYNKTLVAKLRHCIRLIMVELDRKWQPTAELDRKWQPTAELDWNSDDHEFMSVMNTRF
jgi:hypothetical protein